ncbi:ABC transporter permease [Leuconostoc litchii]|uniref:Putative hemin transport system permease protein HrtB n=1 Tax=Leuconostoc litchii TaxID=1981069 RepID=A0A6P2CP23_9LACO|nr:ABC transporter permease [Leuconostoc litchii]TYC47133.1 ABC transporter permease [Leuconostoc litchii]GMA69091.1 ABC transporter permease [Leuconostoc litchii]
MFLALREIKFEKIRYSLIITLILFISYLVFVLNGLATGLSDLNKSAITQWHASTILLDKDAEGRLSQSFLERSDQQKINGQGTPLSQYSALVKNNQTGKTNAQILAIEAKGFIYKNLKISSGMNFKKDNTAVVSEQLKENGFKIGDKINIANNDIQLQIVGFTPKASFNVAPVIYTSFKSMAKINQAPVNGIVFNKTLKGNPQFKHSKLYTITSFISKLPGYQAQQLTFKFMIGFLYIIVFIVISIFLYILTIQKLPNFGVMKAQGISTRYLILNTLTQTFIVAVIGVSLAMMLTVITAYVLPSEVPIAINIKQVLTTSFGILIMSLLGALLPIRQIIKVDPFEMIGG